MDELETRAGSGQSMFMDHVTNFRLSREPATYSSDIAETWWSVLIEIQSVSIDQFSDAIQGFVDDVLIPVAYDSADRSIVLPRQPVVIFARKPLIDALNQASNPYHVTAIQLGAVTPKEYLNFQAVASPQPDILVDDDTVVLAVIDNGIAIGHDQFRLSSTTSRVHFATILESVQTQTSSDCSVGRTLDRQEINQFLDDCTFNGLLDEDLFYAKTGQVDLAGGPISTVAMRASHGTHVLGLASGAPLDVACDNRPIIAAVLPSRLVADTTGLDLLPELYLSFHILRKQARGFRTKDGSRAPVVFNFSYGNTGGPHDGTGLFSTMFEHYFGDDSQINDYGQKAWLVLPAGNSNLRQLHAVCDDAQNNKIETLDLVVQPDDKTPTIVQGWLPTDAHEASNISLKAPDGQRCSIRTKAGQAVKLVDHAGREIARLSYQFTAGATQRGVVTLMINPTNALQDDAALAPAGNWRIKVKRPDEDTGPMHFWVRRDDTLPSSGSGARQAYFNSPDYEKYDRFGAELPVDPVGTTCAIRRSSTLSGFACGASPIVVAGYSAHEAKLSTYSAAGPLNPREIDPHITRDGPDLTAKADDSLVLRGVISAGSRSGSWVRLSGTSMAAPRVARIAADSIKYFDGCGRDWSKDAADQTPFHLDSDPSVQRQGAGGINIYVLETSS